MTRPFRFAVQARPLDDHDGLVAAARWIEALGYDELLSYDHIGAIDPFIPLTVAALRSLLDTGAADLDGVHHQLHLGDLGIRPARARVPLLIGGHGKRVVAIAARHADIFQFTGLTHGEGGQPTAAGFGIDAVSERSRWLTESAGDRTADIERSALVQAIDIAPDACDRLDAMAERFDVTRAVLDDTPFVLIGSVAQIVDKLQRLRDDIGISHYVVRDPEGFAPVVEILAGH